MTSERQSYDALPAYFLLVTLLAVPFWLAGAGAGVQLLPGLPVSALAACCPALAAAIIAFRRRKWPGVAALLARSFDRGRAPRIPWLAAAALLPFACTAAAYAMTALSGRVLLPVTVSPVAAIAMTLAFFLFALGEELGWTAFATEPLQDRWGWMPAALFLGAFWAVWHFVPLLEAHRNAQWIAWWTLGTAAQRLIMVWIFNRAGKSVLAVTLMHTAGNLSVFAAPQNYDPRYSSLALAGVAGAVAVVSRLRQPGEPA